MSDKVIYVAFTYLTKKQTRSQVLCISLLCGSHSAQLHTVTRKLLRMPSLLTVLSSSSASHYCTPQSFIQQCVSVIICQTHTHIIQNWSILFAINNWTLGQLYKARHVIIQSSPSQMVCALYIYCHWVLQSHNSDSAAISNRSKMTLFLLIKCWCKGIKGSCGLQKAASYFEIIVSKCIKLFSLLLLLRIQWFRQDDYGKLDFRVWGKLDVQINLWKHRTNLFLYGILWWTVMLS